MTIGALFRTRTSRIAAVALIVLVLDQVTKAIVLRFLGTGHEEEIVPGFFKLVHWTNTGAAWSLFADNNALLAVVAVIALIVLFLGRHHFDSISRLGQTAQGLIFGGIMGNLVDRVVQGHVIDFLYFYVQPRGAVDPIGFPAFNVADTAICTGVGLVFLITWRGTHHHEAPASTQPQ